MMLSFRTVTLEVAREGELDGEKMENKEKGS